MLPCLLPLLMLPCSSVAPLRPHVLLVLADDIGWNNIGWHARTNAARAEVSTPALDALVAEGVELERAIAFKYCSPSRCALQSGRNPIHVNVHNDVFGNNTGIPLQMTCLASKLKLAGYRTIAAGKWHAGMQHPGQTPRGRGYDAALTYFNPDNDYWANTYSSCPVTPNSTVKTPIVDLWEAVEGAGEGPAFHRNNSCPHDRTFVPNNGCMDELGRRCALQWDAVSNSPAGKLACVRCAMEANITACGAPINQSAQNQRPIVRALPNVLPSEIVLRWCDGWRAFTTGTGCRNSHANGSAVYEDVLFARYLRAAVATHENSVPLFVFFAPHSAHTPMQAQEATLARFDFISHRGDDKPEHTRQTYMAMIAEGDAAIGGVVEAFRSKGLWEHTLMIYSSDNGGPSYLNGTSGANNYPLKGGKMSNLEGGIRVGSFISGGVVPDVRRGTKYGGLIGLFDWYTTLCSLAGVSAVDHQAAQASLPPVDGLDLSAALLGVVDRPMAVATTIVPGITHRNELAIGTADSTQRFVAGLYMEGPPRSNGTRGPLYKLLLGTINQNAHSGPLSPNRSMNATLNFPSSGDVVDWTPDAYALDCGNTTGCLWDVRADPEERDNLARGSPPSNIVEVIRVMNAKVAEYRAGALMRIPGPPQPEACAAAVGEHSGYWGPFTNNAALEGCPDE